MFKYKFQIPRKVAAFKRGIYLMIFITISSCTSSKTYSNQTKITNSIESKEVVYVQIEGNEFMVNKIHYSEMEKCINENESVRKLFITKHDSIDVIKESRLANITSIRRVIKRGNLSLGLPERFMKTNNITKNKLCINKLGIVTMSRIVESDLIFQEHELEIFLACILDYKFASDSSAGCLERGILTIIFDAD